MCTNFIVFLEGEKEIVDICTNFIGGERTVIFRRKMRL